MPLFDYLCPKCRHQFEALVSFENKDELSCPKCAHSPALRQIVRFRIGGRGDLRESTLHGCHEHSGMDHLHEPHSHTCGERED